MTDKRMIAVFHYDNGRCGSEPYKYEELKRGKWVWGNEKKSWHKCSVCGESAYSYYDELDDNVEELFDYCPYCGADMRAEQTEPQTVSLQSAHISGDLYHKVKDEPQIFICPIQDDYEALIEGEPQTEYERASEQREHDILYEPTYNEDDGSV